MTTKDSKGAAVGGRKSTSLLYDPRARAVFFQVALVAALVFFFWWIINNTLANMAMLGTKSGFGFLNEIAGFQIVTTLGTYVYNYTLGVSTYWDVFLLTVLNTLVVAVFGVVAATIIGFLLGVFRLSSNVVLRGFATAYIELLRNIPLLLQLFFWYFAVLRTLPSKREKASILFDSFHINITGLYAPLPVPLPGFGATIAAFVVGVVAAIMIGRWSRKRQEATGQQFPAFWTGFGVILALPLLTFMVTGSPMAIEHPEFFSAGDVRPDGTTVSRIQAGFANGVGMTIIPEFIALWLALTLYTAAFIAEIVRAGILAVPWGQTEASRALGISPNVALRKVIIPQAMRVIIPPLTSQYLNLTKNSSLATAIAYPDLVSTFAGTVLNQTGQAIEIIAMTMAVYLTISLATSAFMNWFNSRMKLVER